MSSNQSKVTSSISQRMAFDNAVKKMGRCFSSDLGTVILVGICYIVANTHFVTGDWNIIKYINHTKITVDGAWYKLTYHYFESGKDLLTISLDSYIITSLIIACIFFCIQVIGIMLGLPKDMKRIRKLLSPIDDIAIKAEELSKMSFDADKYQEIENAITNVKFNSDKPLDIGDDDLIGIETAMNNMLIKLRESYEKQARFVNDASHELRTPIAVIDGYANMLARWGKEDEKILEEGITAIQHESKHMEYLVNQLLFLARGDAGRMRFELKDVSLSDLMQEVYEESLMIDENHPYRYQKPDKDIRFQVDEGLMKQAVRILVDNSAKYTKEHDEIILSVGYTENNRPYLQVQDTGIGMAEADVEHMFERFYRADEARSYNGTGLGLSIAKWIVDKHKGHFEITSRTNLGTRIKIVL